MLSMYKQECQPVDLSIKKGQPNRKKNQEGSTKNNQAEQECQPLDLRVAKTNLTWKNGNCKDGRYTVLEVDEAMLEEAQHRSFQPRDLSKKLDTPKNMADDSEDTDLDLVSASSTFIQLIEKALRGLLEGRYIDTGVLEAIDLTNGENEETMAVYPTPPPSANYDSSDDLYDSDDTQGIIDESDAEEEREDPERQKKEELRNESKEEITHNGYMSMDEYVLKRESEEEKDDKIEDEELKRKEEENTDDLREEIPHYSIGVSPVEWENEGEFEYEIKQKKGKEEERMEPEEIKDENLGEPSNSIFSESGIGKTKVEERKDKREYKKRGEIKNQKTDAINNDRAGEKKHISSSTTRKNVTKKNNATKDNKSLTKDAKRIEDNLDIETDLKHKRKTVKPQTQKLKYHKNMARLYSAAENRTPEEQLARDKNTAASWISRQKSKIIEKCLIEDRNKLHRKLEDKQRRIATYMTYANFLRKACNLEYCQWELAFLNTRKEDFESNEFMWAGPLLSKEHPVWLGETVYGFSHEEADEIIGRYFEASRQYKGFPRKKVSKEGEQQANNGEEAAKQISNEEEAENEKSDQNMEEEGNKGNNIEADKSNEEPKRKKRQHRPKRKRSTSTDTTVVTAH